MSTSNQFNTSNIMTLTMLSLTVNPSALGDFARREKEAKEKEKLIEAQNKQNYQARLAKLPKHEPKHHPAAHSITPRKMGR